MVMMIKVHKPHKLLKALVLCFGSGQIHYIKNIIKLYYSYYSIIPISMDCIHLNHNLLDHFGGFLSCSVGHLSIRYLINHPSTPI